MEETASISSASNFWLVAAPSQNFEDVPTINVGYHEVPLPAYFRLLSLVESGQSESDIVQDVIRHTGAKNLHVVTEIVSNVAENQRLLTGPPKSSNRFSMAFRKSKKLSDYRASRVEARRDLYAVEEQLETAKQTEKKVLNEALILSQRKEELKELKMTPEERRKTTSAIEQQMKQVLQKHRDVEAEIKNARRLSVIHKTSLV
ncbi:hypothetical protein H2200_006911 [Cladophialophora chaetospira]|uniref:Uncharacterized protein n=1 Tax=Cladophialophora chaetospira TaxID=386627 RepID=A0AA38X9A3_9EURO|nr:hypothetical protein H2200_006911 [Cladophialophora chaetospira]